MMSTQCQPDMPYSLCSTGSLFSKSTPFDAIWGYLDAKNIVLKIPKRSEPLTIKDFADCSIAVHQLHALSPSSQLSRNGKVLVEAGKRLTVGIQCASLRFGSCVTRHKCRSNGGTL